MNKKVKISLVLLSLIICSVFAVAGVVTYLSNTAQANISVSSPMTIQFASVGNAHLGDPDQTVELDYTSGWEDNLNLVSITGFDTIDLGVKVVNNSEVAITSKTLVVTVSNSLDDVDIGDINSLQFYDIGASIGSGNRIWQELSGLAVDNGTTVTYSIPINSLAAETTYKYPVTVTFGVVAPADYTITATLLN